MHCSSVGAVPQDSAEPAAWEPVLCVQAALAVSGSVLLVLQALLLQVRVLQAAAVLPVLVVWLLTWVLAWMQEAVALTAFLVFAVMSVPALFLYSVEEQVFFLTVVSAGEPLQAFWAWHSGSAVQELIAPQLFCLVHVDLTALPVVLPGLFSQYFQ